MPVSRFPDFPMQVLVDADACPVVVKDMLFRAARRVEVCVTLVANQYLRVPPSRFVKSVQVPATPDAADQRIVELAEAGDLVITSDIPLAAAALDKGAFVLDTRGGWFSRENIRERLAMREMLDQLRGSGVDTGGPAPYSPQDGKAFASQLDRFLARHAAPRDPAV
ncbi:YaiI/YqxD family protein [Burkholderia sp. 3C]